MISMGWLRPALLPLCLLACFGFTFPRWADWNQNSRLDQTMALVNDSHLYIDDYRSNTGDYAYFEGHYYSDKAPGVSLLSIHVYAAFRATLRDSISWRGPAVADSPALNRTLLDAGGRVTPDRLSYFTALVVVTLVVVAIPSAVLSALVCRVAGDFGCGPRGRLATAVLYALGTCAFAYSNALYSHQLSAALLFAAFTLLLLISRRGGDGGWRTLWVGALLGTAVLAEFPTAIVAGCLAV